MRSRRFPGNHNMENAMVDLNADEQSIVSEIQGKYEALSADGKQAVAVGVSWAERNIWWVAVFALGLGLVIGNIV